MNIDNKELTQLVKTVKAALRRDHHIDIPHSALRASVLSAIGEHPHAFSAKATSGASELKELIAEAPQYFHPGYDFEGKKLEWLKRAGLVPFKPTSEPSKMVRMPAAETKRSELRHLYLVGDTDGILQELALDPQGDYRLPEGHIFADGVILTLHAELPKVKKYGFPDYFVDVEKFFKEHFGLQASSQLRKEYIDLGDDSGDSCALVVQVPDAEWNLLIQQVLSENPGLSDDISEWTGTHYGKNFDKESLTKRSMWVWRFIEASYCASEMEFPDFLDATFEWLWPDQDSDSLPCRINMRTGELTLQGEAPAYDTNIEFRIFVEEATSERYPAVWQQLTGHKAHWHLAASTLKEFCKNLGI